MCAYCTYIYIKNTSEAADVFTTTMLCQADADELCQLLNAKAIVDHTRHTLSNKPTEKCMEMDKIVKRKTTGIEHKSVDIDENITSRPWITKLCRHRDRTWNLQGKHDPLEALTLAPRFFHTSCCVFRCFSSAQDKETPKVLDLQALAVFKPLTYGLSIVPFLKATASCRDAVSNYQIAIQRIPRRNST